MATASIPGPSRVPARAGEHTRAVRTPPLHGPAASRPRGRGQRVPRCDQLGGRQLRARGRCRSGSSAGARARGARRRRVRPGRVARLRAPRQGPLHLDQHPEGPGGGPRRYPWGLRGRRASVGHARGRRPHGGATAAPPLASARSARTRPPLRPLVDGSGGAFARTSWTLPARLPRGDPSRRRPSCLPPANGGFVGMTVHHHVLRGCAPEPLAHYLKALAVLRLTAEQADREARGWWASDVFHVLTRLDETALLSFFLHDYVPSGIVSGWNGGSGFYPKDKDKQKAVEAIARGTAPRFARCRRMIHATRAVFGGRSESPKNEEKAALLRRCRAEWADEALDWLDAAVVI